MSSKRTGAAGKAAIAAEPVTGTAAADAGSAAGAAAAEEAESGDAWFAPALKSPEPAEAASQATGWLADDDRGVSDGTAGPGSGPDASVRGGPVTGGPVTGGPATGGAAANGARSGDATETQAEWFLRTGRAGLLPDSMTVSWDDDSTDAPHAGQHVRVDAAGAPPWAAEAPDGPATATPPPWETGPWPGPGGAGPAASGTGRHRGAGNPAAGGDAVDGRIPAASAGTASSDPGGAAGRAGAAAQAVGLLSPRAILVAGLVPLVLPGLVAGVLGLRQAGARSVRKASVLAIAASIAWAVIIIVIVASGSGSSAGACAAYPAAVHQAYNKAMADLHDRVPAAAAAADLETAASVANASAAAAGQIGVRTALFAMANDLAQARDDVVAHRPVPATLRMHLTEDGATPPGACAT
jgi:hypothetical protein